MFHVEQFTIQNPIIYLNTQVFLILSPLFDLWTNNTTIKMFHVKHFYENY